MTSDKNDLEVFTQTNYGEGAVIYDGSEPNPEKNQAEIDSGLIQAYHDGLRLAFDSDSGEVIFYDNLSPVDANVQALTRIQGDEVPFHDSISYVETALEELNRNRVSEVEKHDVVDDVRSIKEQNGIADSSDIEKYHFNEILNSYLSDDDFDYDKWPDGISTPEGTVMETLNQIEEEGKANLTAKNNSQAIRYMLTLSSYLPSVARSGAITEGGFLEEIDDSSGNGERNYDVVINTGLLGDLDEGIEPNWLESPEKDESNKDNNSDDGSFFGNLLG